MFHFRSKNLIDIGFKYKLFINLPKEEGNYFADSFIMNDISEKKNTETNLFDTKI